MATDCEVLSEGAKIIFEKIKPYFPPDPWNSPNWLEEGVVRDNGFFDLRKSQDRTRLIEKTTSALGSFVETVAGVYHTKNGSLEGFEIDHFGMMIRNKVGLLFVLKDLDFQIETMDFVDL